MMTDLYCILFILLLARLIWESVLLILNRNFMTQKSLLKYSKIDFIDTETLQKTVTYSLAKNQFEILHLYYETLLLTAILFSGLIPQFLNWADLSKASLLLQSSLLFLATSLYQLCFLPLDYFYQFSLETRFGFNRSTKTLWISDQIKGILVSALISIPLIMLLFYFIRQFQNMWWIWGTLGAVLLQVVMIWLYPKLILPLFNKLSPLSEGSLKVRLTDLAQRTGFKAVAIQILDSSKRSSHSNAYCSSLGKVQHIVLYDTLLKNFSNEEIEAILAHEIGHYKCKHILKQLVMFTILTLLGFKLADMLFKSEWLYQQLGIAWTNSPLPLFVLSSLFLSLITYWFHPLSNYFSRRYEYEADAFAGKQSPECAHYLIQSLKKLYKENLSNLYPHPWFSFFHYSHPTLFEREQHLKS